MASKSNPRPTASKQVLVRLPDDLAERFASTVPSRKRSRFLVDLLRRELERECNELQQAARLLTEYESRDPRMSAESDEWLLASLVRETDNFDPDEFESQFREAQSGQDPGQKKSAR